MFKLSGIRLVTIFLVTALVVISVQAQESSPAKTSSARQKENSSIGSASALLKPPSTASPRATLISFIENMDRAYGLLMKAHRNNLKTPGFFPSEPVRRMAKRAEEYFESSVECLNLSQVPKNLKVDVGYEGAIMLKEVLDRIDLPPVSEIPNENAIDSEDDPDKKADMIRWRIPNTDIIIDRVEEGAREGEFLFAPETVARLEEFYIKVKDYPYKLDALISHDFFDFYVTNPGRLLPPKWSQWLPGWSDKTFLDQTIWQWCALIVLPLGVLLIVRAMVRWWYQRTAELSSGRKTIGWLVIVLITVILVSLIKYILNEHINITGTVLIFLENTLQRVFILLLFGLILWEFVRSQVKENIEKEDLTEQAGQGEEGGAGGSRSETLLLLLRKTILFVMFTIVFLLLLSSMGINIGPLLAGAGVIGLAIGFGAQTLVRDIIAGIFFLIDDAFRVGDYIETGGLKGSVEHISLRSLRLRSPRGPVHTIPFGSMGTVTNNSRDYIISKLDFRVRYDTNVDKVRKIIKKINKKIMKDEEMGPVMLDKLKSQGVRELDDSAMIMRVKFKTIPGEQFVIRREVFRMMQEEFSKNGIEFAHRNVTVYMPPGEEDSSPDKKAVEAGAAAAVAAEQADAEQKKTK